MATYIFNLVCVSKVYHRLLLVVSLCTYFLHDRQEYFSNMTVVVVIITIFVP